MSKLLPLLVLLIIPACQSGPYSADSPYYRIPVGSRVEVKKVLTIPANRARVYLQFGKSIQPGEVDQYSAHCWFLSWEVLNKNQTINPDTFIVTHVQEFEDHVLRQGTMLLASSRKVHFWGVDGGSTAIEYSTEFTIHSDEQQNIRKLVCNHWEDPSDARHLTLTDIRMALNEIAEIHLNER